MKFVKYKYKGTTVASVTLSNPDRDISLYPGKEYKLDADNLLIQQWVKKKLLEPLEEVKVGVKKKTRPVKKAETVEVN